MLSTDWWLKKALKFALKRYLGQVIQSEIDADQLEVQLGEELIELKQLLLKCDYINSQLGDTPWELKAGCVGKLQIRVPLTRITTEPCTLLLDEVLLTVRLKPGADVEESDVPLGGHSPPGGLDSAWPGGSPVPGFFDDGPMATSAITQGITKIAGGMKNILQKLKVEATRIAIRFELPADHVGHLQPLIIFKLGSFSYQEDVPSEPPAASIPAASFAQHQKAVHFSGLTIELFEDELDSEIAEPQTAFLNDSPPQETGVPGRVRWADETADHMVSHPAKPGFGIMISDNEDASDQSENGWHDFSSKDLGCPEIPDSPAILVDHTPDASDPEDLSENRHIIICDRDGVGCNGSISLTLQWQTQSQQKPNVQADVHLNPFQVQLHPHHLPLIASLISSGNPSQPSETLNTSEEESRNLQHSQSRMGFTDILMPSVSDTVNFAQDIVYQSWCQDRGSSGDQSEYYDAESFLGSIRTGLSSFYSASASGLSQGASYFSSSLSGFETTETTPSQQPTPETGKLRFSLATEDLSLVLWYPQNPKQSGSLEDFDEWPATDNYRPRLSFEASDVAFDYESLGATASANLQVFRVEAVEHIPDVSSELALPAQILAEMVRVPGKLPEEHGLARQVPNYSGVYVNPMPTKSMYASMMSQISSASVNQADKTHSVQISPVLCLAGSVRKARGSPSLAVTMDSKTQTGGSSKPDSLKVYAKIRPISVWISVPLLTRITAFLQPLVIHLGTPQATERDSSSKAVDIPQAERVGREIASIVDDLQHKGSRAKTLKSSKQSDFSMDMHFMGLSCFLLPERCSSTNTYLALEVLGPASRKSGSRASNISIRPSSDGSGTLTVSAGFVFAKGYLIRAENLTFGSYQDGESSILSCPQILNISGETMGDALPVSVELNSLSSLQTTNTLCKEALEYVRELASVKKEANEGARMSLQDTLHKSSQFVCHVQTANIQLGLCKADYLALESLKASYLLWQNTSSEKIARLLGLAFPYTHCSPSLFTLECGRAHGQTRIQPAAGNTGLQYNFEPSHQIVGIGEADSEFRLTSTEITIFAAMGIDGHVSSTYTNVSLSGVALADKYHKSPLLSCDSNSGVAVTQVQRQLSPEALPAESVGHVACNGVTICTVDNDLTFSWLQNLGSVFPSPQGAAAGDQEQPGDLLDSVLRSQSNAEHSGAQTGSEDFELATHSPTGAHPAESRLQISQPCSGNLFAKRLGITSDLESDADFFSPRISDGASPEQDNQLDDLVPKTSSYASDRYYADLIERGTDAQPSNAQDDAQIEGARVAESLPTESANWTVQLQNCAVRDSGRLNEGDESPLLDAALLVGSLQWQTNLQPGRTEIDISNLTLLAAERDAPTCLNPADDLARDHSADFSSLDLCHSRLLDFGYVCLAQEGQLHLTIQSPQGDGVEGPAFGTTTLQNRRLHLPLTPVAFRRLQILLARLAPKKSTQAPSVEEDELQIPQEASGIGLGSGSVTSQEDAESASQRSYRSNKSTPNKVPVAVLAEVDETAFQEASSPDRASPSSQASPSKDRYFVPVMGGMMDPIEESDVPGGAPVIIEDIFKGYQIKAMQSKDEEQEGVGVWYGDQNSEGSQAPKIFEEWVKKPGPDLGKQRSALDPLPSHYPLPSSRFVLQNISMAIALCEEETGNSSQAATTARIELELEGFCLQSDTFDPDSDHGNRTALSVLKMEVKDCLQNPETAKGWHKIFSQHISLTSPRNPDTCVFLAELESIRPDDGNEELRLKMEALPLRLRLDQNVITFLQAFFAEDSQKNLMDSFEKVNWEEEESEEIQRKEPSVFIQRCEIKPITVVIDYKPRRVDVAAIRAGNLTEVVNMTAWSDIKITLPNVRLMGVHGWDSVGSSILQTYLQDIVTKQVHQFVAGIKPLQGILRVGTAAGQLLAIPADALRGRPESAESKAGKNAPLHRQLQRGVLGLVRAILTEMLGISAGALGGVHLVLSGPSAAARPSYQVQPKNMSEGMKQASQRLGTSFREMGNALSAPFVASPEQSRRTVLHSRSSSLAKSLRKVPGALAKPLSEGAAAARLTFLGARNSLDPSRFERQRRDQ